VRGKALVGSIGCGQAEENEAARRFEMEVHLGYGNTGNYFTLGSIDRKIIARVFIPAICLGPLFLTLIPCIRLLMSLINPCNSASIAI